MRTKKCAGSFLEEQHQSIFTEVLSSANTLFILDKNNTDIAKRFIQTTIRVEDWKERL